MKFSDRLRYDWFGIPIEPDQQYFVRLVKRADDSETMTDMVSGEDILAAADFYDQLMSQQKDDSDDKP